MSWSAHPAQQSRALRPSHFLAGEKCEKKTDNAPAECPEALLNPVQKRNLEVQRDVLHEALLDSVHGGNLEDLRDLIQEALFNPVLGEKTAIIEPTSCWTLFWEKTLKTSTIQQTTSTGNWDVNVLLGKLVIDKGLRHGTTTNCSTSCGSRSAVRCGMLSSRKILGTLVTCSATTGRNVTKTWRTSTNWSTTGASSARTSLHPMPPCRSTFPCGLSSARRVGGAPAASSPPSSSVSG